MSTTRRRSRRRAATEAARVKAVDITLRGGLYKHLPNTDIVQLCDAAFTLLEEIGLSDVPKSIFDGLTAAGGKKGADGRLLLPHSLVSAALKDMAKPIQLCGQSPEHDLLLDKGRVYTGTGGSAPAIIDLQSGQYRSSTLRDLFDAGRICDALTHVHFFSRPLAARDMSSERDLDLNTAFACLAGTTKHVIVSASHPEHVSLIAQMCYSIAGSEAQFRVRPFLSLNVNHAVPPLRLHTESCQVMAAAVAAGIPVLANVFGQVGASSPVTVAEALAGVDHRSQCHSGGRTTAHDYGFALQLCVFRYPGRFLQPGELIPSALIEFVGTQLGLSNDDLLDYATRRQTRYEHSTALQRIYGYRTFEAEDPEFSHWLRDAADQACSNEGLAHAVIVEPKALSNHRAGAEHG